MIKGGVESVGGRKVRFGIWALRSAFLMVLVVLLLRRMIASSGPQMVVDVGAA